VVADLPSEFARLIDDEAYMARYEQVTKKARDVGALLVVHMSQYMLVEGNTGCVWPKWSRYDTLTSVEEYLAGLKS
jgi:hypothetical protein